MACHFDLPAIALARPPSASPQANAGRVQAKQAGRSEKSDAKNRPERIEGSQ